MAIASELSEVHPAEDRFLEGVPGSTFGGPRLAINFAADLNVVVIGAVPASHTDRRDCAASTRRTNTVLLGATGRRPRTALCMSAAAVTRRAQQRRQCDVVSAARASQFCSVALGSSAATSKGQYRVRHFGAIFKFHVLKPLRR